MNTPLKTIICATSVFGLTLTSVFAEGKGNKDWAEEAAKGYQKKAEAAAAEGNKAAAKIYTRMAQIKRDAGAASKKGKDFSWKEYHELEGQLNKLKSGKKHDVKKGDKHDWKKGKKNDKKPNNGFLDAAADYEKKALIAAGNGKQEDAIIYGKLASIKRQAANGEQVNWDDYHKLASQLSGSKKHDHKHDKGGAKHDHKGKSKANDGFLKAAADYQEKANKAMAEGNEHNAKIYTQLSNMKKEAAAASAKGKGYDWTEYFALQKQLK